MNAECTRCGVTAADLPYEELDLSLDEASELLFEPVDGERMCQGCAQIAATTQTETEAGDV